MLGKGQIAFLLSGHDGVQNGNEVMLKSDRSVLILEASQ
jgi:hypothetical protein